VPGAGHRKAGRKMIFTLLGAVAELERNLIKERVHMGISRARKQRKRLGRPKRIFDRERARAMAASGMSARQVAKQLGVSRGVIERAL
jgi:putative DNA-invertase from lambdoid prophage Rac